MIDGALVMKVPCNSHIIAGHVIHWQTRRGKTASIEGQSSRAALSFESAIIVATRPNIADKPFQGAGEGKCS
jgi:hypothetical protein